MKMIELGGCVVVEDMPTWWCETDQHGWDGPDPDRAIRVAYNRSNPRGRRMGLD